MFRTIVVLLVMFSGVAFGGGVDEQRAAENIIGFVIFGIPLLVVCFLILMGIVILISGGGGTSKPKDTGGCQ
ncbi:MAG: hypothetical protein ISS36_01035 [Candidatus Aenigmarchaeota archaeon]|nr:hypothetical protein [Candidatus Aenigmarchaeota archaeon]